jgi:hypothetical protein
MLEGYPLEIALTMANSAAQSVYGYDQVCERSFSEFSGPKRSYSGVN